MIRFLVVFCLMSAAWYALGAESVVSFGSYTREQGLSDNNSVAIVRDTQGFMWFGSNNGLNRFDGQQFKRFMHSPNDPNSISANEVTVLHLDSQGQLWIGTSSGLNRFDPNYQRFERIGEVHVNAIAEDSKGRLWVGSDSGLSRLDAQTRLLVAFEFRTKQANDPKTIAVTALTFDNQDSLWIGTKDAGLSHQTDLAATRFEHFTHSLEDPYSLTSDQISALVFDTHGRLWIGTDNGLNRLDAQHRHFTRFYQHGENGLNHDSVLALTVDIKGRLWIGTKAGLVRFDHKLKRFFNIEINTQVNITDRSVVGIYSDIQQTLWLATDHGVLRQLDGQQLFSHFRHISTEPASLGHDQVNAMAQTSDGSIWLGTNGGLDRYEQATGTFIHYRHQANNDQTIIDDHINALIELSEGQLLIGTDDGLSLLDLSTMQFSHFEHQSNDPLSISGNKVSVLYQDTRGQIWVGTKDTGLNRLDLYTRQFIRYQYQQDLVGSLSHNSISAIAEDKLGRLWVGTADGGLNHYMARFDSFSQLNYQQQLPSHLQSEQISSLYLDSKGGFWIATQGAGLVQFDVQTKRFKNFSTRNGLNSNQVAAMVEDLSGQIWISTERGLSVYSPAQNSFEHYDATDGLQSHPFNPRAALLSTKGLNHGELFFGGMQGFSRFWPEKLRKAVLPVNLWLTDILLFDQSIDSAALEGSISMLKQLNLDHSENFITFVFAALDYANPDKVQYAYQLQGWDLDWVYVSADKPQASYANLPPGDYQFKLKAKLNHGHWQQSPNVLSITSLPPWWLTWWAKLMYLLVVISFVALLVLYIVERKKRLGEQLLSEQLQKVDKLKDQFLINTANQLRTPAMSILGLSECLLDDPKAQISDAGVKTIQLIAQSAARQSNLVNDILDFSKLSWQQLKVNLKPLELARVVESVVELSLGLSTERKFKLVNKVSESLPLVEGDELRVQQILVNLVANGVYHSKSKALIIEATEQQAFIAISVIDHGVGMSQEQCQRLNGLLQQSANATEVRCQELGLVLCKQLAQLQGGRFEFVSTLGQGSRFTFTLPLSDQTQLLAPSGYALDSSRLNAYVLNEWEEQRLIEQVKSDDSESYRILLIDNEPINRRVLRTHLEQLRYPLIEAGSEAEAMSILEHKGPFDLIIIDPMMPDGQALAICKQIRVKYKLNELALIFISVKDRVSDLVEAFSCGANDYICKPVSRLELISRVNLQLSLLSINRALQSKLDQRSNQLLKANEGKSAFLAKLSHEIRIPMNTIIGLSRLTLKSGLNESQIDGVEKIVDAGQVVLSLMNDIVDFTRIEAGKLNIENVVLDLQLLIERVVELSAMNAYIKDIELITDIDSNIPRTLRGDPLRIQQIMVNLVNNALKFTEFGAVCIKLDIKARLPGKILLHGCVIDTGVGMNEQQQKQLHKSLNRTTAAISRKHGGTGLGLAIAHQLCELMGGELWFKSEPEQGSQFHFTVMLDDTEPVSEMIATNLHELRALRILVVDDMQLAANVSERLLRELGVCCSHVSNAEDAICLLQQSEQDEKPFDFVFIDWRMPGTDGIALARRLEQQTINCAEKVLLMSSYDKEAAIGATAGLDFCHLLEKPLSIGALYADLVKLCGGQINFDDYIKMPLEPPNFRGYNILLVEDNAINRHVVRGFLHDTGANVEHGENGMVALAKLRSKSYDLVLMDIFMPQIDGLVATREIRQTLKLSDLPIIAMSAQAMKDEVNYALGAGINEFISKPIDPKQLYECLSKYLKAEGKSATGFDHKTSRLPLFLQSDPQQAAAEIHRKLASLNRLSDIDSERALGKLNGRHSLYLGLIKDFVIHQHRDGDKLLLLFDQGIWEELYSYVHALNANAAYIGAFKLAALCEELETSITQGDAKRTEFENAHKMLLSLIGQLEPILIENPPQQVNWQTIVADQLSLILPLLHSGNLAVKNQLPPLKTLCEDPQCLGLIEQLIETVDDLDFEQAIEITNKIYNKL